MVKGTCYSEISSFVNLNHLFTFFCVIDNLSLINPSFSYRVISKAVRYVYNLACKMSPKAALWFMALFYAVSPERVAPLAYNYMLQKSAHR